jgi:hypothetical protein
VEIKQRCQIACESVIKYYPPFIPWFSSYDFPTKLFYAYPVSPCMIDVQTSVAALGLITYTP